MTRWETSRLAMGVAGLFAIALWSGSAVWHYRTVLIDAQVRRLAAQGEIIAGAIAGSAAGESRVARVDPTRVLPPRNGQSEEARADDPALNARASLPAIASLLGKLVRTRARVYDHHGVLRLDTDLAEAGQPLRLDLPPPPVEPAGSAGRTLVSFKSWLIRHERSRDETLGPQNGQGIPEVVQALAGHRASMVRGGARDEVSVSVAVPIVRYHAVRGAILLSTKVSGWFDLVRAIRADRERNGVSVADGA